MPVLILIFAVMAILLVEALSARGGTIYTVAFFTPSGYPTEYAITLFYADSHDEAEDRARLECGVPDAFLAVTTVLPIPEPKWLPHPLALT